MIGLIKKKPVQFGILITIIYFVIHVLVMDDYGLSWDFHYHHYAGRYHLGLPVPSIDDPPPVPFTPPDPRLSTKDPFGPFIQIIPSLSHYLLYQKYGLTGEDNAYNFPMVVFGSLGVGLLFLFLYEALGLFHAISGFIFLGLMPVYFGYLHNNMKDIPNAFAFSLTVYLFWRLVKHRRLRDLFFAVISFAFAFNIKINSIVLPVIFIGWLLFAYRDEVVEVVLLLISSRRNPFSHLRGSGQTAGSSINSENDKKKIQLYSHFQGSADAIFGSLRKSGFGLIILFFILSPIAALVLWWPFWEDPLKKLLEIPYFYSHNTLNMPVLFMGKMLLSGVNIPWYYPYVYIAVTIPIAILIPFLFGLLISIKRAFEGNKLSILMIMWFFIPLIRYFNPRMGAIDGVRHFMEIVYPLSAIAAIGYYKIYKYLIKITKKQVTGLIVTTLLIGFLIYNIIHFHPFQTSFFNAFIGGIRGAQGKLDIDFWGTPQKQAMLWLNNNAAKDSIIHVVMAQSSAGMYLRQDLVKGLNSKDIRQSDYTVILNRESFFQIYDVKNYMRESIESYKLAYTEEIDGVPLVWVFRN